MITFKDFFSFKNNRFFWINIIAMILVVIVVIFGALKWLDSYTRHGDAIEVPNVKNINVDEAEVMLNNRELSLVVIDSTYKKDLPTGTVLEQNPVPGSKIKKGRAIYVTINSDRVPLVAIPDIVDNSSLRQAEAKLKAMGFKLTEPQYISGEKDWVYGLSYRGRQLNTGDRVPREAILTLTAGNGSEAVEEDSTQIDEMGVDEGEAEVDKSWF
ncbi:PASTA domain-containing protein [Phocaeicola paurosaccharolyticus]|uniref:PASTA domain-containing protein n=1 Tax=Phocaeicola paurosaccharolyticus TaxID=732242 RepID=UPI00046A6F77|nr:PASTA domain-containing protein [Phocaeicola paurosaccharolyticus]